MGEGGEMTVNEKLLAILVCPKCKGGLEHRQTEKEETLTCHNCKLLYPVKDGIPVMLIEEARAL